MRALFKRCHKLLIVSSCKNHKKYFAIKGIISLFRVLKNASDTFHIPFCNFFREGVYRLCFRYYYYNHYYGVTRARFYTPSRAL